MRLAGQQRGGFYPCPPLAISEALRHLDCARKPFSILDPCAGEGMALDQLARMTGGKPYGIELDAGRAAVLAERIPDSLGPASVFGCKVGGYFDLLWLNPPYDDELGGGRRVEHEFLQHCTPWLKPGGVLCLVVPDHQIGFSDTKDYLLERYEEITFIPFPNDVRRFNEVIAFGYRRAKSHEVTWSERSRNLPRADYDPHDPVVYHVPSGPGPRSFEKVQLTDDEVGRALAASKLQRLLEAPKALPLPRPPLPLAKGHIAMLLASGHLDGVVRPEGEPPHVVRGTAAKKQYLKEQTEEELEDGSTKTKTVYGEKIVLTVRAVDGSGTLRTFAQE